MCSLDSMPDVGLINSNQLYLFSSGTADAILNPGNMADVLHTEHSVTWNGTFVEKALAVPLDFTKLLVQFCARGTIVTAQSFDVQQYALRDPAKVIGF